VRKLLISKQISAILREDCKWTVSDRLARGYLEPMLNQETKRILGSLSPSDGEPLDNVLLQLGKVLNAKVINTEPVSQSAEVY